MSAFQDWLIHGICDVRQYAAKSARDQFVADVPALPLSDDQPTSTEAGEMVGEIGSAGSGEFGQLARECRSIRETKQDGLSDWVAERYPEPGQRRQQSVIIREWFIHD